MHHSFTKRCVTLGSALVLGLACNSLHAQTESKPPKKALIQFDSLMARWKSGEKAADQAAAPAPSAPQQSRALFAAPQETAASALPVSGAQADAAVQAASAPRKALIPPNTIFNRQLAAMQPPQTATPLPPTSLVLNHAAIIPVTSLSAAGQPVGSPISTSVPPSLIAQAQLLAGPMPPGGSQPPVIIVMQTTSPDIINFAPREISRDVPNDFWPAESRNPLGRRDDHGLFTWPKFAKKIAGETVGSPNQPPATNSRALFGGSAPAEVPLAPAATNDTPSALFSRSEPAAPVQSEAKALFGRKSEPAPQVAAPAAPLQPKALFAKSQPAPAPVAAPSEVTAQDSKSRALFAFGRQREAVAPTAPAPVLAPQAASVALTPAPSQVPREVPAAVEAIETPPQAPTLTEVKAAPPVAKSPDLKWRAKGSPRSTLVEVDAPVTEAVPNVAVAEAAPTEVVKQVVPASAPTTVSAPAPSAVPATSAPPVAMPQVAQPQPAQPQLVQPTKSKALLSTSFFGRKWSQATAVAPSAAGSHVAVQHVTPPKRANEKALMPGFVAMVTGAKDAAAEAETDLAVIEPPARAVSATHVGRVATPPIKTNEKALVPGLMAMVKGAKDGAVDTESADLAAVEPAAGEMPVTHVAPVVDMASRRSYYAPAVEYVVDTESARKQQQQAPVEVSHRKTASPPANEALDEADGEELCADDGPGDGEELCDGEEPAEQVVQEPTPPVRRQPPAAKTQAARVHASQPMKKKSYRRLTLQELTAGLLRPLSAVNEMTKLPFPKREVSEHAEAADDLIAQSEPPVVAPPDHTMRGARRPPPVEEAMFAAADEELGTDPPVEVEAEKPRYRSPAARPKFRPARSTDIDVDLDQEPVLASDDPGLGDQRLGDQGHDDQEREATPQRLRNGRRQVTVPVVSLEDVGDESTKDLPAMRVRNRNGGSVLIYSGSDATREEQASARSTGRQNPLR